MSKILKGVVIGAGYFGKFQYDAWSRIPEVYISALCDFNEDAIQEITKQYAIPNQYSDYREMLIHEKPDFVDIITPPDTHYEIVAFAADLGINIICQKPLAPTYLESKKMVDYAYQKGVSFVVHENFRFQPWHREIKKIIDGGEIGELFNLNFIKGEDCALMFLNFKNEATALWDASRYNESNHPNPRYTFGEYLIEGSKGSIRLYYDGKITIQKLGQKEKEHLYTYTEKGFAGDSCFIFQNEYVKQWFNKKEFETSGENYLKVLQIQEAVYESAEKNRPIFL